MLCDEVFCFRSHNACGCLANDLSQPAPQVLGSRCAAADFSKVGMGAAGITQLCAALASNTALETLLLETNNMGDEGAALLAQTLAGGLV